MNEGIYAGSQLFLLPQTIYIYSFLITLSINPMIWLNFTLFYSPNFSPATKPQMSTPQSRENLNSLNNLCVIMKAATYYL